VADFRRQTIFMIASSWGVSTAFDFDILLTS
jgi:hypothetical protein